MNSTSVIRWLSTRDIGVYRYVIGESRKEWARQHGKPVKRLRMKRNTQDVAWSYDVRARDGNRCAHCNAGPFTGISVEAAHIIPRRYVATRHLTDNGITLCFSDHRWAHREETEFLRWWAEQYPERATVLRGLVPSWKGWRVLDDVGVAVLGNRGT